MALNERDQGADFFCFLNAVMDLFLIDQILPTVMYLFLIDQILPTVVHRTFNTDG